jgi:hypothetical protein
MNDITPEAMVPQPVFRYCAIVGLHWNATYEANWFAVGATGAALHWSPIIIASGAMGYVVSTTTLYQTGVSETQVLRSHGPSEIDPASNPIEPAVTPGDRSTVLTRPEVQLPAPASS